MMMSKIGLFPLVQRGSTYTRFLCRRCGQDCFSQGAVHSGLTIDTSKMSPQEAARKISEFFSLNGEVGVV